jgi:hypothetical protein
MKPIFKSIANLVKVKKNPMMSYEEMLLKEKEYLGGGYFVHEMFKDGRLRPTADALKLYEHSGETMFDLDRIAGGTLNTSVAGKKFWSIIDAAGWKTNPDIPWNYMGGEHADELLSLLHQIIKPTHDYLMNTHLSPKSLLIVNLNQRLYFNFLYAVFNGSGWFDYFADAFNIYVDKQNITDPKILMDKMIDERINNAYPFKQPDGTIKRIHIPLIEQGGRTIQNMIDKGVI